MRRLILLIICLLCGVMVVDGQFYVSRKELVSASDVKLYVSDQWLGSDGYLPGGDILVRLHYDDSHMEYFSSDWGLAVVFDGEFWDAQGVVSSVSSQEVRIDYSSDVGVSNTKESVLRFPGFVKGRIKTTSISLIGIPTFPEHGVWLELEYVSSSHWQTPLSQAPVMLHASPYLGYLQVGWSTLLGNSGYDLEWLFVDHGLSQGATSVKLDWRNATRIHTRFNSYLIPLQYPKGEILFRVRGSIASAQYPTGIETLWNIEGTTFDYDLNSGMIAGVSGQQTGVYHYNHSTGFQPLHSWQYSASYAEDGLRSEAGVFYDDLLRPIQNVSVLQSKKTSILSETIYDGMGRAAISFLPHPAPSFQGVDFYTNQLLDASLGAYNYLDFDSESTYSNPNEPSTTVGAAKYYSSSNATDQVGGDYIPDAQGYVYSRTKYLDDGSGRVKSTTGIGEAFSVNTDGDDAADHAVRYYYGSPTQVELDRLFGNEAGLANTHMKNLTVDPNGQVSVSYVDVHGRTVATALSGPAPLNQGGDVQLQGEDAYRLVPLESEPEEITEDLTDGTVFDAQTNTSTTEQSFTVGVITDYNFDYSIDLLSPLYQSPGQVGCLPTVANVEQGCSYVIEIYLKDNTTGELIELSIIGTPTLSPSTATINAVNNKIIISGANTGVTSVSGLQLRAPQLGLGSYSIFKQVSLYEPVYEAITTDYLNDQQGLLSGILSYIVSGTSSLSQMSLLGQTGFSESDIQGVSQAGFNLPLYYQDCESCWTTCIGDYLVADGCGGFNWTYNVVSAQYPEGQLQQWPAAPGIVPSQMDAPALIASVQSSVPANIVSLTSTLQAATVRTLLTNIITECSLNCSDVSLSQGGNNDPCEVMRQKMIADLSPEGIYFESVIPGTTTLWMDEYIPAPYLFDLLYTDGTPIPSGVTWADLRQNWQPEWSEIILEEHPEYCTWSFYCYNWNFWDANGNDLMLARPFYDYAQVSHSLFSMTASNEGWNPFQVPPQNDASEPGYQPYTLLSTSEDYRDGFWIDLREQESQMGTYYSPDDGPFQLTLNWFTNSLLYSFPIVANPSSLNDYVSIYWLLDEGLHGAITAASTPAQVNAHLTGLLGTGYSNDFVSLFMAMHGGDGSEGAIGTGQAQVPARTIFLGYYNFMREYFAYYLIQSEQYGYFVKSDFFAAVVTPSDNTFSRRCINGIDWQSQYGKEFHFKNIDPMTGVMVYGPNTPGMFTDTGELGPPVPLFAQNDIFEMLSAPVDANADGIVDNLSSANLTSLFSPIADEPADLSPQLLLGCQLQCASAVDAYLNQYAGCISLSPEQNPVQYQQLREVLIDMCGSSCSVEYPQGSSQLDEPYYYPHPNGTQVVPFNSFNDAINFFGTPLVSGDMPASYCGFIHPPANAEPSEYDRVACTCDKIDDLIALFNELRLQLEELQGMGALPALENFTSTDATNFLTWLSETFSDQELAHYNANYSTNPLSLIEYWENACDPENNSALPFEERFVWTFDQMRCGPLDEFGLNDYFPILTCQEELQQGAESFYELQAQLANDQIVASSIELGEFFVNSCVADIVSREQFTMNYILQEYQYTLYFYDRAGNLIKTVPPEGVFPLRTTLDEGQTLEGEIANSAIQPFSGSISGTSHPRYKLSVFDVAAHRSDPASHPFVHTDFIHYDPGVGLNDQHPEHELKVHQLQTYYTYNSYNQLISQKTPDGGRSYFWYDPVGRIVWSENERQRLASPRRFSYSFFDDQGRVTESGEARLKSGYTLSNLSNLLPTPEPGMETFDLTSYEGTSKMTRHLNRGDFENFVTTYFDRFEVVKTYYDQPSTTPLVAATFTGGQQHLRGRVAYTEFYEKALNDPSGYTQAVYYSYDIHGNVQQMINEDPSLAPINQHLKTIDYQYDLISGQVKQAVYQRGKWDAFYHRYFYDDDNRITLVETSRDGYLWTRQAKYFYYLHGPLARTELGEDQVYGADYAYTLQGWLKSVNGDHLIASKEMGRDGVASSQNPNRYFSRDVFGFSLTYFQGDYAPIAGAANSPIASQGNLTALHAKSPDLFNGNISKMVTAINVQNLGGADDFKIHINGYRYDQLNRIKVSRTVENTIGNSTLVNSFAFESPGALPLGYQTDYSYDRNGNLLTLNRRKADGVMFDRLAYTYRKDGQNRIYSNKLREVNDFYANPSAGIGDVGDQTPNNYAYDPLGQLVKDVEEEIAHIEWSVTGKIKEIIRNSGSTKPDLEFQYDAMGNRVCKIEKTKNTSGNLQSEIEWIYTYYRTDATGNVMAVYQRERGGNTTGDYDLVDDFTLKELNIYGSSRIGTYKAERTEQFRYDYIAQPSQTTYTHHNDVAYGQPGALGQFEPFSITTSCTLIEITNVEPFSNDDASSNILKVISGRIAYEISNHLGNVQAVISDKKVPVPDAQDPTIVAFYNPGIITATDYYPFGMVMPNRSIDTDEYRYGYQAQLTDQELWDGAVSYKYRIEDPRIGRFFSVDPLAPEYPWNSPYAFSENRVIDGVELEGLEFAHTGAHPWSYMAYEFYAYERSFLSLFTGSAYFQRSSSEVIYAQSKLNIKKTEVEKSGVFFNLAPLLEYRGQNQWVAPNWNRVFGLFHSSETNLETTFSVKGMINGLPAEFYVKNKIGEEGVENSTGMVIGTTEGVIVNAGIDMSSDGYSNQEITLSGQIGFGTENDNISIVIDNSTPDSKDVVSPGTIFNSAPKKKSSPTPKEIPQVNNYGTTKETFIWNYQMTMPCTGKACYNGNTLILTSKNQFISASQLKIGDLIKIWSDKEQNVIFAQIQEISQSLANNIVSVEFLDGDTLILTENHALIDLAKNKILAGQLKEGSIIESIDGRKHVVRKITTFENADLVYSLILNEEGWIITESGLLLEP